MSFNKKDKTIPPLQHHKKSQTNKQNITKWQKGGVLTINNK